MKIQLNTRIPFKKHPVGSLKSGARLDLLLDALTTAQAAGVPDGANVTVEHMGEAVVITWEEDR